MELRPTCERCQRPLPEDGVAYVCSHDCTWCPDCYRTLRGVCANCGGELVRRPRRSSRTAARPRAGSVPQPVSGLAIRPATVADVPHVAPLFDAYRRFYGKRSDLPAGAAYLTDRLQRAESVVFLAELDGTPVGFVQLYPLFSSLSLGPMFVLNDLFVLPERRRHGVGRLLLGSARAFAAESGAHSLELSTAVDNPAQRLYEADGWVLDTSFAHFDFLLADAPNGPSGPEGRPDGRPGPGELAAGQPARGPGEKV